MHCRGNAPTTVRDSGEMRISRVRDRSGCEATRAVRPPFGRHKYGGLRRSRELTATKLENVFRSGSLDTIGCNNPAPCPSRAPLLLHSLVGQDTRLSPERPGFESRWRNSFCFLGVAVSTLGFDPRDAGSNPAGSFLGQR